jgi:hypothetical protein
MAQNTSCAINHPPGSMVIKPALSAPGFPNVLKGSLTIGTGATAETRSYITAGPYELSIDGAPLLYAHAIGETIVLP